MINPNRYLSISVVATLALAVVLSFLYQYRALSDLQTARLQTDQVISRHLPETVYTGLSSYQPGQNSFASRQQTVTSQQLLERLTQGLDIIALELLSLDYNSVLVVGELPEGVVADPAGFEQARRGVNSAELISPSLFGLLDDGLQARHIQVSRIAIYLPNQNEPAAVLDIYSDLSAPVKAIYLTQLIILGVLVFSLCGLDLFLHRRLKKDKVKIQQVLDKDSKAMRKADRDALTGLPNRTLLNQRLTQALEQSQRQQHSVVVMFLDLDGFKAVNDTLGHHVGDQLLKIVAQRLNVCVREGDTVSRLGGDEFVVVLPMFDSRYTEQAPEVAQRILESLAMPMKLSDRELQLGCSIGVSRYPEDGKSAEILLKNADTAMYQAKEQGRNNVQFFSLKSAGSLSTPTNLKGQLELSLQRQEFKLLFQPQVDLKSEAIVGVSVFLYWLHPATGMTLAEKILPAAKKNSPVYLVGQWMLQEACLQRMNWQQQGVDCGPLTVYLKANLFEFSALESHVREVLESTRLQPQYLELELTDCLLYRDVDSVRPVVERLRALGVKISIDGTEFSLNYMRQLPLDRVRIGHRCIKEMLSKGADSVVAQAIIALCRKLPCPVIAEGVDTDSQREYLRGKGCDQLQGLCTSPTLSAQEALKLLRLSTRSSGQKAAEADSRVQAASA